MTESLEAELFNREISALLSGRASGAKLSGEAAKDVAFAAKLCLLDLSGESRIHDGLKARLAAKQAAALRRPWSSRIRVKVVGTALGMGLSLVCMGLVVEHFMYSPDTQTGGLDKNWGIKDGGAAFMGSHSPYEQGLNGLAPGNGLGSGDVITPLHASDPAALIASEGAGLNREGYDHIVENTFLQTMNHPLSTFSIDVDAASYANARRFLGEGKLPPKDAVRVEEFINYFRYDYPEPEGKDPLSITTELALCPWNPAHKLVRVGLKGRSIGEAKLPPANLVFLIDSSGSMMEPDKLPLLKSGLRLLVERLRPKDRVTIVTYAGSAGLVLPATSGKDKTVIIDAIEKLEAGGSTAGGEGIKLAYDQAAKSFMKKGLNRVILATDGDFNVGVTSDGELVRLIEEERERGVYLTVLGFGKGNYQDSKMKKLADAGNGNYAYVDDIAEARRVLVQEMSATLLTIAKDVKIQVEFNPARAYAYRLIGYESRLLKPEDFNNDKKDAGELGAGHTVTALYEIVPPGAAESLPSVDPLKYQKSEPAAGAVASKELLTVKFRYKDPAGGASKLIARVVEDTASPWAEASRDFHFAAAAAGFGMLLHGSSASGDLTYAKAADMARGAVGKDEDGYRGEFIRLVEKAALIDKGSHPLGE